VTGGGRMPGESAGTADAILRVRHAG
jgi:hypothetical protein